ncbi:MAG: hypothetical protein ACOCZ6_00370 [Nanoarchaeota archaeon]
MIGLNKRGVKKSLWTIVDIVFITILILAVFPFINDVKEDTYFEKKFLSKDMALLLNTLQYVPGDVHLMYPDYAPYEDYVYNFEDEKVSVSESKEAIGGWSYLSFFYFDNTFLIKNFDTVKEPSSIYFSKLEDSVNIDTSMQGFGEVSCPKPSGAKIEEEGRVFIVEEKGRAGEIFNNIIDKSSLYNEVPPESGVSVPVLLIIEAKESDKQSIGIHYLNKEKNTYALACNIKNFLSEKENLVSPEIFKGGEEYKEFLAIRIELGYKDSEDIENLALGIKEGIEEYDKSI